MTAALRRRSRRLRVETLEPRLPLAGACDAAPFSSVPPDLPANTVIADQLPMPASDPAEGESGITTRFRFVVTDDGGSTIHTVNVGDTFYLEVLVQDMRSTPTGLFAAYLDVTFDANRAWPGPVEFGPTYPNSVSGILDTAGLIDEAGATDGIRPLGGDEYLLFRVSFTATRPGVIQFEGAPADILPEHLVLRFGTEIPVPVSEIDYGSAELTVVGSATAVGVTRDTRYFYLDATGNGRWDRVIGGDTFRDFPPRCSARDCDSGDRRLGRQRR